MMGGLSTQDEMCFNFIQIVTDRTRPNHFVACVSEGLRNQTLCSSDDRAFNETLDRVTFDPNATFKALPEDANGEVCINVNVGAADPGPAEGTPSITITIPSPTIVLPEPTVTVPSSASALAVPSLLLLLLASIISAGLL